MSDSLEISTLGKLEIRRNERTIEDFPTRKVEALLVYLPVQEGRTRSSKWQICCGMIAAQPAIRG